MENPLEVNRRSVGGGGILGGGTDSAPRDSLVGSAHGGVGSGGGGGVGSGGSGGGGGGGGGSKGGDHGGTGISQLTLKGRMATKGMDNYRGVVWYRFASRSGGGQADDADAAAAAQGRGAFVACEGTLGGPVVQVVPNAKALRRDRGRSGVRAFEVNLEEFTEVGLETVPMDQAAR